MVKAVNSTEAEITAKIVGVYMVKVVTIIPQSDFSGKYHAASSSSSILSPNLYGMGTSSSAISARAHSFAETDSDLDFCIF